MRYDLVPILESGASHDFHVVCDDCVSQTFKKKILNELSVEPRASMYPVPSHVKQKRDTLYSYATRQGQLLIRNSQLQNVLRPPWKPLCTQSNCDYRKYTIWLTGRLNYDECLHSRLVAQFNVV